MRIKKIIDTDYITLVINSKSYIYGCAIILVLLYHLFCICSLPIMELFSSGAVGVDIFMFLGGLTLGYSYEKRSLSNYYWRRVKRIVPLWFLFTATKTILHYWGNFDFLAFLFSITGLSYWGLGGIMMEWYLTCLLFLYIIYPIIYGCTNTLKFAAPVLVFLTIVCFYMFTMDKNGEWTNLKWYHNTFYLRLPIFFFGVYLYTIRQRGLKLITIFLISTISFIVSYLVHVPVILPISCLSLMLIIALCAVKPINPLTKALDYLGKYTLEIYVGNCFCQLLLCDYISIENQYILCLVYVLLNLLFSIIIIKINKYLNRMI